MRVPRVLLLLVVAILVNGCEMEKVTMDDPSANMNSVTTLIADMNNSFLVISKTNKLPAGLENSLAKIDGKIERIFPEVGIVVASSADPLFTSRASKINGILGVLPNLKMQFIDPGMKKVALSMDAANPPTSGDDDFYFDLQWGHDAVNAPEAWEAGYRGAGVRVGILDTGFDVDHPDLAPNINFALCANFIEGETLEYGLPDAFSHGTHTAGTVAAADNAFGTIGIAPEAELVLIKVLSDEGYGDFGGIMAGILHAASVECDVINMSIGGWVKRSEFKNQKDIALFLSTLSRVTTYATQMGVTIIASAGNEEVDCDHIADWVHLPSGAANVLCVSATAPVGWAVDPGTNLDVFASYSNYGQSAIDFAAPGGDYVYPGEEYCTVAGVTVPCYVFDMVFSTGNNAWYWSAGTSMSAPHVAGVAALIIGKNGGDMKPAQVKAALIKSADDLGKPGKDDYYGLGRVNALMAVAD